MRIRSSVSEIHVDANQTVAWTINATRAWHVVVVPDLLNWTLWKMDTQWYALCEEIQSQKSVVPYGQWTKPMKLAAILEFIGTEALTQPLVGTNRCFDHGASTEEVAVLCRRVSKNSNRLDVVLDPTSGRIVSVTGY